MRVAINFSSGELILGFTGVDKKSGGGLDCLGLEFSLDSRQSLFNGLRPWGQVFLVSLVDTPFLKLGLDFVLWVAHL